MSRITIPSLPISSLLVVSSMAIPVCNKLKGVIQYLFVGSVRYTRNELAREQQYNRNKMVNITVIGKNTSIIFINHWYWLDDTARTMID
jgi:hypothetical protein